MPRTLILGLDVGDGHLVRRWATDGELPHFRKLIAQGAWGWLATPAATLHVSAWPSLYTGTHPGEHGVYYTFQPARGVQGAQRFGAEQYRQPTLWQVAAGSGKRCVVLDAPYTHPEPVIGYRAYSAVYEWGTWAHYWKPGSSPAGLYKELVRAVGEYPLGLEANRIGLVSLEPRELRGKLVASLAAKARAIRWLLTEKPWDLAVSVFGETHLATHYLWPGELEPEAAAASKSADLLAVYKALDDALGSVLEATDGDETAVYVVSGDGGGPNHSGWHLLPEVLRRLGYTQRPGEQDGPAENQAPPRTKSGGLLSKLRGAIPDDFRQAVSRHLPSGVRDALMKRNRAAEVDWARTQAYCLPTDLEGWIRFNVEGREPEGIVAPGELDALCAKLAASLRALVNPATGEPAAARVVRTSEAFPPELKGGANGGALDALPDLIVVWDGRAPIASVRSDEVGTVAEPSPDERVGTHRPPGFVIARGPGFAPGSELRDADVLDFAPTVLGHLGVEPTARMTGRRWTDPS